MPNAWINCIECNKQFYYDDRVQRCARCSRIYRTKSNEPDQ